MRVVLWVGNSLGLDVYCLGELYVGKNIESILLKFENRYSFFCWGEGVFDFSWFIVNFVRGVRVLVGNRFYI